MKKHRAVKTVAAISKISSVLVFMVAAVCSLFAQDGVTVKNTFQNWTVATDKDAMSDEVTQVILNQGTASLNNVTVDASPNFTIMCTKKRISAGADIEGVAYIPYRFVSLDGSAEITYRFDTEKQAIGFWHVGSGNLFRVPGNPRSFIKKMEDAQRLRIAYSTVHGTQVIMSFELAGVREALQSTECKID